MMSTAYQAVLIILVILTLAWFVLVHALCHALASRHPQKYESLGRPRLFSPNPSPILRFLFTREYQHLGDSALSQLANRMRLLFVVSMVLFASLVAMFSFVR
jgi:hypothetical protein